jgi:hypothetical protein
VLETFSRNRPVPGRIATFFDDVLAPKLKEPVVEIVVHLVVTFLSVLSIALIEVLLIIFRLDGKEMPGSALLFRWLGVEATATLGDWMFLLEVVAATVIIVIGIGKACYALVKS